MPSGFSFGFSGDDIEEDVVNEQNKSNIFAPNKAAQTNNDAANTTLPSIETKRCNIEEMVSTTSYTYSFPCCSISNYQNGAPHQYLDLSTNVFQLSALPSRISYTTTIITSPIRERRTLIPRRALFDVKMQLMAEDDNSSSTATPSKNGALDSAGLGDSDIETDVYEGGYKSWEGAMDLARLLLERGPRKDIDDLAHVDGVIELGAGTALPTLVPVSYTHLTLPTKRIV